MFFIDYLLEYNRYCNIVGIFVVLAIAYFFSFHRSRISYRLVMYGLIMQYVIGFLVLRTRIGHYCVNTIAQGVTCVYTFADAGSRFVFGSLVDASGPWGFIFAIKVLPVIIFFWGTYVITFLHGHCAARGICY